ncbi:MAG: hypothetical protein ABSD75_26825 [Terriglobales bacterium]
MILCLETRPLQGRAPVHSGPDTDPVLFATNQQDQNLSIIDPDAARQIAVAPVEGKTGHEVAV